ncbi:MAG: hypothetical protein C5B57_07930 [Blastocatellia bacterium]|nr:MAG: hypothetical protein C5B57_07930 [Blastocatellia bacterium]
MASCRCAHALQLAFQRLSGNKLAKFAVCCHSLLQPTHASNVLELSSCPLQSGHTSQPIRSRILASGSILTRAVCDDCGRERIHPAHPCLSRVSLNAAESPSAISTRIVHTWWGASLPLRQALSTIIYCRGIIRMSHDPRISVIIPCFNLGRFIDDAIDSVFAQTYSDFEVVVVDDGSSDEDTKLHLDRLARPRTRVIRSENRGLSAARNLGVSRSCGPYLCSLDADDRLEPTWFERAVAFLDAHPEVTFVSHWLEAFGDQQWVWKPGRCDLGMLLDFNMVNGAALFRREIVDVVGGFDESMRDGCEDWEFWIRVTEAGYQGVILPEVMYHYRQRPDSMSRAMNDGDKHLRLYGMLVNKHRVSFEQHLLDLTLRRERSFADMCRGVEALQEEIAFLEPALVERRLELERARETLAAIDANGRLKAERNALQGRVSELAEERDAFQSRTSELIHERDDFRDKTAELIQERNGFRDKIAELVQERDAGFRRVSDLEHSWSWRVTLPLRRIFDWVGLLWR